MEVVFAQEEIKKGDVVTLNEMGHLVKYIPRSPVGVAAHDIHKGDAVKLHRDESTKDILVKWGQR